MRSLSVKTALLIYLTLFLVLLGATFGISYEIRHQSYKALEEGFTVNLKLVVVLSQINEELRHIDSVAEEYLLTKEDFFATEFEILKVSLEKKLANAAKLSNEPKLIDLIQKANEFVSRRAELIGQNRIAALSTATIHSFVMDESPANQIFAQILALEEFNLAALEERRQNVDESAKIAFYVILLGSLVAALIFSIFLARLLVWPISKLARATSQWRLGDKWTESSPVSSQEFVYLYDEMRSLSHRLNSHYSELVRSNRDLEEFASIASHDLRGPLNNIGGFVEIISEKLADRATNEEKKCLATIASNVQRMEFLVQNLLAYAKIGATTLNLSPTSLNDLVDQVTGILAPEIHKNGAKVTKDDLPTLQVDREQLVQLFQNLFENSIKYRRSEPLKIHISAHLQGDDWVVSVADNGIGIPKHDLHRVFEIFRRSVNVSGARGVGLGLSIVKRIIERHGGSIWLESVLGKGTTVFFTLGKDRAVINPRNILAEADKENARK